MRTQVAGRGQLFFMLLIHRLRQPAAWPGRSPWLDSDGGILTWVYDYKTDTWTEMKPKLSPSGSDLRFMAFDPVNNVTINVCRAGPAKQTWVYRYRKAE